MNACAKIWTFMNVQNTNVLLMPQANHVVHCACAKRLANIIAHVKHACKQYCLKSVIDSLYMNEYAPVIKMLL